MTAAYREKDSVVYDLTGKNDESSQYSALDKDQRAREALLVIMLDAYKQKVANSARTEIEEQIKKEYERSYKELKRKYHVDTFNYERLKLLNEDLERQVQRSTALKQQVDDRVRDLELERDDLQKRLIMAEQQRLGSLDNAEIKHEIEQLRTSNSLLDAKLQEHTQLSKNLQVDLALKQDTIAKLQSETDQLSPLTERYNSVNQEKQDLAVRVEAMERSERDMKKQLEVLHVSIAQKETNIARLMEVHGEQDKQIDALKNEQKEDKAEISLLESEKRKSKELRKALLEKLTKKESENETARTENQKLLDENNAKNETIASLNNQINDQQQLLAQLNEETAKIRIYIEDRNKKVEEGRGLVQKYKNALKAIKSEKEEIQQTLNKESASRRYLKREVAALTKTAKDSWNKADNETQLRIKVEHEKHELEQRIISVESENKKLTEQTMQTQEELHMLKTEVYDSLLKANHENKVKEDEISKLTNTNSALSEEVSAMKEQLGALDLLEKSNSQYQSDFEKIFKEVKELKHTIDEVSAQSDMLQKRLEREVVEKNEILGIKESLEKERKRLQENITSYTHSLNDLQLLLDSERQRSESLERERKHLKKCLEISQKAFEVNKQLDELKGV